MPCSFYCHNPNSTSTQSQLNSTELGLTRLLLFIPPHHPTPPTPPHPTPPTTRNSTSTRNNGSSGLKFCMWPHLTKLTTTQHNFCTPPPHHPPKLNFHHKELQINLWCCLNSNINIKDNNNNKNTINNNNKANYDELTIQLFWGCCCCHCRRCCCFVVVVIVVVVVVLVVGVIVDVVIFVVLNVDVAV